MSLKKAVELAIFKASETLHGISWFEAVEFRGAVKNGKPSEWQAAVDLGFDVSALPPPIHLPQNL